MTKEIQDEVLGAITLRHSARATRYSLKIGNGQIIATMPPDGDERRMLDFIRANRERLAEALRRYPRKPPLDEGSQLETATFRLHIFRTERNDFYARLTDGVLHIACPRTTRFEEEETQSRLRTLLEGALRHEAKRLLPARTEQLAREHGFTLTGVKINSSRSHWGSCTARKSVNLSLWLMALPWHLIDYVLLHELCHTVEMNHGERFWRLLDQVTDRQAHRLRDELRTKRMP